MSDSGCQVCVSTRSLPLALGKFFWEKFFPRFLQQCHGFLPQYTRKGVGGGCKKREEISSLDSNATCNWSDQILSEVASLELKIIGMC